jgi:hypothetical protein
MKKHILLFSVFVLSLVGCNSDDSSSSSSSSISFAQTAQNLTENETPVVIKFSKPTSAAGTITLGVTQTEATYGEDYTTNPEGSANGLQLSFEAGVTEVTFQFNKLIPAVEGQVKNVKFTIVSNSLNLDVVGNPSTTLHFNETALSGTSLAPEVGGAGQPNQVYIDLSSGAMTTVPRVSWDLGFYSGSEFRVILNYSVKMSAKSLNSVNMATVVAADESMLIGQGQGSVNQIDFPSGDINQTAIAEVSANDSENYVYLINLGNSPSDVAPALGAVSADTGAHRGWKKVRILRDGDGYKFQYADINATTFQEVTIAKDADYSFTFFSFNSNSVVNVEPKKDKWDINFTTFTNIVGGTVPYFYPDFVVNNGRAGAMVYSVSTNDFSYESFSLSNVNHSNFSDDQRGIGSSWRGTSANGPGGFPISQFVLKTDIFYVLRDPAGNIYKIKMTGGALESQERGHPTFVYELL